MTTLHPPPFTLSVEAEPARITVRIAGDLDYETCDELLDTVAPYLDERRDAAGSPDESSLHLDFGGLGSIDSMGLSALLMIRRRSDASGVRLRLEQRPTALERLLDMTGTLHYLTAPREESDGRQAPGTG
ncbi:STAS domain-containing protein [Streptomyces sp. NPDC059785]|uniref:STAS domain-containing protein n=1 Tax=unclassified Streptomyces TaxID=2593676 RepID=UPI00364C42A6